MKKIEVEIKQDLEKLKEDINLGSLDGLKGFDKFLERRNNIVKKLKDLVTTNEKENLELREKVNNI